MILAGDIGGTHTRLALARRDGAGFAIEVEAHYPSREAPGLEPLLALFRAEHPAPVEAAGFGVPGPVDHTLFRVKTTNLPWEVEGAALEAALGAPVALANDLEAAAHGVLVLDPSRRVTLQEGAAKDGNCAVIAAGTGLGEAFIVRHGAAWIPSASEGGHSEFGPRDETDVALWHFLQKRHGHVSYERIVSGPGLVDLYEFHHQRASAEPPPWEPGEDRAAAIARAAHDGTSSAAQHALRHFVTLYGAEAGNLALKVLAFGGVYIAGGIAPKILHALERGEFIDAFRDKGRYRRVMEEMPVHVVTDPQLALRGAARAAALKAGLA